MARDLILTCKVGRFQLGKGELGLNDHINYYVSAENFLSGQVTWNRNQVTSPFMEGAVTTYRNREMVMQNLTVEVMGEDMADLRDNIETLVEAFTQDSYYLAITMATDGAYKYRCEAADYLLKMDGPRMIALQVQVQLSVPAQPVPMDGWLI